MTRSIGFDAVIDALTRRAAFGLGAVAGIVPGALASGTPVQRLGFALFTVTGVVGMSALLLRAASSWKASALLCALWVGGWIAVIGWRQPWSHDGPVDGRAQDARWWIDVAPEVALWVIGPVVAVVGWRAWRSVQARRRA